jgi:hypothetical protein
VVGSVSAENPSLICCVGTVCTSRAVHVNYGSHDLDDAVEAESGRFECFVPVRYSTLTWLWWLSLK